MHCKQLVAPAPLYVPTEQASQVPLLAPPQLCKYEPAEQADEHEVHELKPAARLYDVPEGQAVLTVDTLTPMLPPPGHAKPAVHCVRFVAVALAP